jgi:hypothetical protein
MTSTGTAAKAPLTHGQAITVKVKEADVFVRVQAIRVGAAYRASVLNGSGFEIDKLTKSYPTETAARHHARMATTLLRAGWTVPELIALVAAFNPAA